MNKLDYYRAKVAEAKAERCNVMALATTELEDLLSVSEAAWDACLALCGDVCKEADVPSDECADCVLAGIRQSLAPLLREVPNDR